MVKTIGEKLKEIASSEVSTTVKTNEDGSVTTTVVSKSIWYIYEPKAPKM